MKRHGVTIGKFWPFHLGHDLMIQAGMAATDEFTIVIANDSKAKNNKVFMQMFERYGAAVKIVEVVDTEKYEVDENGIATDPDYIKRWADRLDFINPRFTHVVTSDLYGKPLAELMGCEWIPVDPDRKVIPISSTMIRNNLYNFWQYIVSEARLDWAFKVAILGPESTGKSTLAVDIAKTLNVFSHSVPEYGRTLSEAYKNLLSYNDFRTIMTTQNLMIKQAAQLHPLVITDTEAVTTAVFGQTFLNPSDNDKLMGDLDLDYSRQKIDLFIVLKPDNKWVDDGTRVMPNQDDRWNFYHRLLKTLDKYHAEYVTLSSAKYTGRVYEAINLMEQSNRARTIC